MTLDEKLETIKLELRSDGNRTHYVVVGEAMAECPQDIPWQRVINSQGKISQRFDAERQKQLLENEGLVFVKGKLNLTLCQWGNLEQEDVPEQASLF